MCLSRYTHRIGTNVLESRYDEIIANPTARVSGMNSDRSGSPMMKAGMNTDRMQSKARSRGTAVMLLPRSTAVARFGVRPICTCTFSTVTVASSTRMPIASARPPSDMMLIVLPVSQSPNNDPKRASGMLATTTITLLGSRRNRRIISPVKTAPIRPSEATLLTAASTVGDSSNSKLTVTSLGTTSRNNCIDLRMSATTVNVEAVSFLMIGR